MLLTLNCVMQTHSAPQPPPAIIWTIWFHSGVNIDIGEGEGQMLYTLLGLNYPCWRSSLSTSCARHCGLTLVICSGIRWQGWDPLTDWCPTHQLLTDPPPTVGRLVPDRYQPLADRRPTRERRFWSKLWTIRYVHRYSLLLSPVIGTPSSIHNWWEHFQLKTCSAVSCALFVENFVFSYPSPM